MEPIVQIIISEDIETRQNGVNTVNLVENPVLVLGAPIIPTALTFSVTVVVAGIDFKLLRTIELVIKDKENKTLFSSGETQIPQFNNGSEASNMQFSMNLKNVLFNYEGQYMVQFILNKVEHTHNFSVRKQAQQIF